MMRHLQIHEILTIKQLADRAARDLYQSQAWVRALRVELDDLAQESFIGAVQAHLRYDGLGRWERWVYWGGFNSARHYLRDHASLVRLPRALFSMPALGSAVRIASLDAPMSADGDTLAERLRAPEPEVAEVAAVRLALRALPSPLKQVAWLCLIEGYTQSQVADIIGVSQSYIGRVRRRAIAKLREALG